VTEAQVDACSWSPYTGGSAAVDAKRRELQAAKMKQGEVQFFRFGDVSGIFQFYPARDGFNIQVDRCDDGVTGVGQNYLWDRYPGEVDPQTPAHTLSVGLAGAGLGTCGTCGKPAQAGLGGCCGQTVWDPSTTGHHPSCDWEWGTCTCNMFLWDYSSAPDDPGCTYQEPNYGSDQIHLTAGIGPLGPEAPETGAGVIPKSILGPPEVPSVQPTIANAGLGQAGLGQTVNPDGTVTNGDITYTQPTSGPSTPGWAPGTPGTTTITPDPGGGSTVTSTTGPLPVLPPANQTQPGTQTGGGSWGPYPTQPTSGALATGAPAPATNTGMLVLGLVAVGLGIGGIAYLAHARTVGAGSKAGS